MVRIRPESIAVVEIGQALNLGMNRTVKKIQEKSIGTPFALISMEEGKMRTKILALLLLGATSMFAGVHFSVGVGVGGYYPYGGYYVAAPPPPPPAYYAPGPAPAPGYAWVGGYYYPVGAGWAWRAGYWARPPYAGAVWVGPRYHGGHYHGGYWRHR